MVCACNSSSLRSVGPDQVVSSKGSTSSHRTSSPSFASAAERSFSTIFRSRPTFHSSVSSSRQNCAKRVASGDRSKERSQALLKRSIPSNSQPFQSTCRTVTVKLSRRRGWRCRPTLSRKSEPSVHSSQPTSAKICSLFTCENCTSLSRLKKLSARSSSSTRLSCAQSGRLPSWYQKQWTACVIGQ